MFNDDLEYASSRLSNSLVRAKQYDIGLVKVSKFLNGGDNKFSAAKIQGLDKNLNTVFVASKDIEFCPGPLGYVNTLGDGAMYVTRMPIRRDYKQGLRSNQLMVVNGGSANRSPLRESALDTHAFLLGLCDCMFNVYPKFEKVLDLVEDTGAAVAISKHFAVSDNFSLLYRGQKVGGVTGNGELKLSTKFNFLEDELTIEAGDDHLAKL